MTKTETVEITRASSKGQVVIPTDIRKTLGVKAGSIFFVTSKGGMIVLKKVDAKMTPADLKTLKKIEEAWSDIKHGRYKTYTPKAFSKELAKW